jgi:hypothetical protein
VPVDLSEKVSFGMSAQHSQNNVLSQLVERKQYQKFHHPLHEAPKAFVTYPLAIPSECNLCQHEKSFYFSLEEPLSHF